MPMLPDHRIEQERRSRQFRGRQELAPAFGNFIAGLAEWDWFINPITFRDRGRPAGGESAPSVIHRDGSMSRYGPDPRLGAWFPSSRVRRMGGPPVPDAALAGVREYLADVGTAAATPIGWVIGEEFGNVAGRYHCHILVAGAGSLRRDVWWEEAFRRFGRTRIERFDPGRAAAYYTAKYAAKQLGGLHFGGTLAGVNLEKIEQPKDGIRRGTVVARSAAMPRGFFHMTIPRKHR